jgi:large subunit ribosomal protein L5e
MPFIKVQKSKAYFKRFQVKYKRRREGKTDYRARKRLVAQDKNKYNSPKYRFVVRFTNKDVICQIMYSTLAGDKVVVAAYSHELPRFGAPGGLTNYAAAYATGLLAARRVLTKFNLADKYAGNSAVSGEDYNVEELEEGPRPFLALLDVGLRRTTTGAKVFAALKGACDGGVNVPHSETRFVGYDSEAKKLDAEVLKKHILGGHVADYMKHLKSEDNAAYERQFSAYIKAGVKPEDIEARWTKTFAAIRANPAAVKSGKAKPAQQKFVRPARLTHAQRKEAVKAKLAAKKQAAADE